MQRLKGKIQVKKIISNLGPITFSSFLINFLHNNQPTKQHNNITTNQTTKQPNNQTTKQPTNKPTNQPTNQPNNITT